MTIQKRIVLASTLSVVVSALLIVILWAGYEHLERLCHVTCVYNRELVDRGVENSQTMLYIVPRGLSQVMLISAVICFAVMTLIASQRVGRAVLIPLRELKRAAEQVAEGDLDDRIAYEGRADPCIIRKRIVY